MTLIPEFLRHPFRKNTDHITTPFKAEEVTALIRYVTENGIVPGDVDLKQLHSDIENHQRLKKKLDQKTDCYSAEEDWKRLDELAGSILTNYGQLASFTAPVNERTLLDTCTSNSHLNGLFLATFFLLILAFGSEIIIAALTESVHYTDILKPLEPFFWGALGACVYLLKLLLDYAQDRQFDKTKSHGFGLRIILGGVLGTVFVTLFGLADPIKLDTNAIAFLVGLGIKVFYGVLERLIDYLANKLELDSIRRTKDQHIEVKQYLIKQIESAAQKMTPLSIKC